MYEKSKRMENSVLLILTFSFLFVAKNTLNCDNLNKIFIFFTHPVEDSAGSNIISTSKIKQFTTICIFIGLNYDFWDKTILSELHSSILERILQIANKIF